MEDKSEKTRRRTYAKGFHDALSAAGIGPEEAEKRGIKMNQGRMKSIINGLSGVAKKVYDATPISEAWNAQKIQAELVRQQHNIDPKTVQGCLSSLVSSGIVGEVSPGQFKRIPEKAKATPAPVTPLNPVITREALINMDKKAEEPPAEKKTPIEILSTISTRISVTKHTLEMIAESIEELVEEIDEAAIIIAEQFEESEGRSEKLKQLQALLKSLG